MAILDDLAEFLETETTMTVHQAVLLVSSDEGLPRVRMGKAGVSHHALFNAPAGRFFCDLESPPTKNIFSEMAAGNVVVGELVRLDPKQQLLIEGNWPSRKVRINDDYYTVPRNFARPLAELVTTKSGNWRAR